MLGVDCGTEQRGLSVRRCAGAGAGSCLCPVRRHGGEAQLCIARLQPALASSSFHTEPHLYRLWPLVPALGGGKQETLAACCLLLLGADNVFITGQSHTGTHHHLDTMTLVTNVGHHHLCRQVGWQL